MEETRAQAYQQLIETLLNCPNGEENQILNANLELVDAELVQTMVAVAAQFSENNQENAATFLLQTATQIANFLGTNDDGERDNSESENSQEYENFILELLQAEPSSSNIKVIYSILRKRQHLLNANFAEILQEVAENLIAQHPEAIELILRDSGNLSIHISNFPGGKRTNNIEIAITGYQIVLNNREPGSEKCAQTQNNLAAAYTHRIKGSRADNLERAIGFFQAALTVLTREDFPEKWAATQHNLANAYRERINGSRADNLERAIEFYEAALTVYTFADFREKMAMTQNNLGNAYRNRINGSRADNLERAIGFFQATLTVYNLEDFPADWAITQNNLGNAYSDRIKGSRADNLERAIGFLRVL
jgi:tetratricopeptide (TPR) repeat protein